MITNEETIATDSSTNVQPPVTGSPIIIGGGGGPIPFASCKFKGGDYRPRGNASGRTKFVSVDLGRYMKTLKLKINGNLTDLSPFLEGAENDSSEIEIECDHVNDDLKFYVRPLAVEFDTSMYKRQDQPDEQGYDVYQSAASYISKVRIRLPGLTLEREFSSTETCEVLADFVPPV